jgi:AraC-like DNA-binding protein
MQAQKFNPQIKEVYIFEQYSLLTLKSGEGIFQVDFKNYNFPAGKSIFLAPGQYFQLLSGQYNIIKTQFATNNIEQEKRARYLFKHLISLGYVDLDAKTYRDENLLFLNSTSPEILGDAISKWLQLNPFKATKKEIDILFDIKDIVDDNYRERLSTLDISNKLSEKAYRIKWLTRKKLDSTVKKMVQHKLLLEAKRKMVFTSLSTKQVAYELGFSEPNYFNRFFKQFTGKTPYELREKYSIEKEDNFTNSFNTLVNQYYKQQHKLSFYAQQLNIAPKTLSKKINLGLQIPFKKIIVDKLVNTAKELLQQGLPVNEVAFELGFNETAHFSSFFKKYTGKTPSSFTANC